MTLDEINFDVSLDSDGLPTEEFLNFIEKFEPRNIDEVYKFFLDFIKPIWGFAVSGFKLKRRYGGVRKLVLHTSGWSSNEIIIESIIKNPYLTYGYSKYVKWTIGGHYYFEIEGIYPKNTKEYLRKRGLL